MNLETIKHLYMKNEMAKIEAFVELEILKLLKEFEETTLLLKADKFLEFIKYFNVIKNKNTNLELEKEALDIDLEAYIISKKIKDTTFDEEKETFIQIVFKHILMLDKLIFQEEVTKVLNLYKENKLKINLYKEEVESYISYLEKREQDKKENIELRRRFVKLKDLYLDPNNYRFIESEDYVQILEEDILNKSVQDRTMRLLMSKGITDILESMKDNGYLEVDNIQVKEIRKNKFLVIEGNRRIASLKILEEQYNKNKREIGNLDPKIFLKLPVYQNESQDKQKNLIIMGLKHISGNKKWDSANQAKLIYDYLKNYIGTEAYLDEEIKLSKSLAIKTTKVREFMNSHHLMEKYKESKYGENFTNKMFSIFAEAIKKNNVCEWIGWDKKTYDSDEPYRLNRFFSWISPLEREEDENYYYDDPIITKGLDIRELDYFIKDMDSLEVMQKYRSVQEGKKHFMSKQYVNVSYLLKELEDNVRYISKFEGSLELESKEYIRRIKDIFDTSFPSYNLNDEFLDREHIFNRKVKEQFTEIYIENYKLFNEFKIDRLKKINIITGINNSGKSSLIEIIYLLTNQNDIVKYINLVKERHKVSEMDSKYLYAVSLNNFSATAQFNNETISINMKKYKDINVDKKDDYIASYEFTSKVEDEEYRSKLHTYIASDPISECQKIVNLCNNTYQSPYIYSDQIIRDYNKMLHENYKGEPAKKIVLNFMKKMDKFIEDIELTEDNGIKRFLVRSSEPTKEILDLRKYGEGIQRIYSLALSFMANRNGVIVIDELEVGIHYTLLLEVTKFIQELCEEFNVQVFVTTHSKECIEAFVKNKYKNDMIGLHQIINDNGKVSRKYISGERFEYLSEAIGLDVRGGDDEE